MSYSKIKYSVENDIAWIGFGVNEESSMTTLAKETLLELREAITAVKDDKSLKGLIFYSEMPGCFLAGVDVNIIAGLNSEAEAAKGCEQGQSIFNDIEDLKFPTMAMIDGVCLGGGLELALSCDRITISDSSKTMLGLPEVKLGVLPGFGGTYRLPRKVGLTTALDMILTGKNIRSKKNLKIGLAEFIMPADRFKEKGPEYLKKSLKERRQSFSEKIENVASDNFISRKIIFQKAREKVLETSKGFYPAPLKILDLLESGYGKSRSSYLNLEGQMFAELSQTKQSKALQHIFFLTDGSKKILDKSKATHKVKKGAVLGAGTMGGGIAWLFASANQAPIMKDINKQGLELGFKQASSVFAKDVKKRKMSEDDFQRKMRSIKPSMNYDGFKNVDLVIEAVVENMDIKKSVFAELEKEVREDCLITSNTSSLSIEDMSSALEKPERFAGLHFFNPVNKMPLVEIIRHSKASEETIQSLYAWCLKAKKTPIIVNDGPGFLVNRILMPFINESVYLLQEGVSIKALDQAVLNFGMPMGTCRLMDEIGIDVLVKVGKIMYDYLGDRALPAELSKKATDKNLLGKKSNKGFYVYDESGKSTGVNPEMESLLPSDKKDMSETEIQMRVFLPMINEAANILGDHIVDNAETVDLGLIYGIGFPPFRGGLLKYADGEGLERISESIKKYAESVNKDRYSLSSFLNDLVAQKKKFYDL